MRPHTQRLRIVVTGLIAQHPWLGGVAWDYLQYPLGLSRLGHDVYYLEDSGEWPYTLDGGPTGNEWIANDCNANVAHLSAVMERLGLGDRWAYRYPIRPRWFGMPQSKRREVLRTADLLINVSGTLKRPADYRGIKRLAYIDSDPVFTQVKLASPRGHLKFQRRVGQHDVYFSFGECLSASVPETPYTWQPTRQPIVLDQWARDGDGGVAYTTVMSWTSYKPLRLRGERYGQKDVEFPRFVRLPQVLPQQVFEVALNATEHVAWESSETDAGPERVQPRARLAAAGWRVSDARRVGADLDSYRSFIQASRGEWSVAKNGYVKGTPGWFSCRSACYLAAGRPVIVQDTGFGAVIPTGRGVLSFTSLDEAVAAIREVEAQYKRHSAAAREIADNYFDASTVLESLVERAMSSSLAPGGGHACGSL